MPITHTRLATEKHSSGVNLNLTSKYLKEEEGMNRPCTTMPQNRNIAIAFPFKNMQQVTWLGWNKGYAQKSHNK